MKHCIIVKWNESVTEKDELRSRVAGHFEKARVYEWIEDVAILPNCIDRPNRYDLAIVLSLAPEKLPLWDACPVHKDWKEGFSSLIAQKAIFDFEA